MPGKVKAGGRLSATGCEIQGPGGAIVAWMADDVLAAIIVAAQYRLVPGRKNLLTDANGVGEPAPLESTEGASGGRHDQPQAFAVAQVATEGCQVQDQDGNVVAWSINMGWALWIASLLEAAIGE